MVAVDSQVGRDIRIVTAGVSDLSAIQRLEAICFPQDQYNWADMFFLLAFGEAIRLKAVVGGQIVGFAAAEPHTSRRYGWIVTLCVLPDYQRRGIGGRLLADCERQLTRADISRARLRVRVSNAPAISLYAAAGYREIGREANYYVGPEDALVMEKAL